MNKLLKRGIIFSLCILVILLIGSVFIPRFIGEALSSECESYRSWSISEYTIEQRQCLGWAGPPFYPSNLYRSGELIDQNKYLADNCFITFISKDQKALIFDVCKGLMLTQLPEPFIYIYIDSIKTAYKLSSNPMLVIDGVPTQYTPDEPLDPPIKANNIFNIKYITQGESTIYGSKDTFGVISITTQSAQLLCPKAIPKPAFIPDNFEYHTFQLLTPTLANEIIVLDNSDSLSIKHSGCEYLTQSYTFSTSRFKDDHVEMWYRNSVKLLSEIEPYDHSPIHIQDGINALVNYIDDYSEKSYGDEITVREGEIGEYVSLDSINQTGPNRYTVTITFSIGPL